MKNSIALAAFAIAFAAAGAAQARDQVQVAGSSTVLPFANVVAEAFGQTYPNFKTPVVESGGSSGGLKSFCEGVGEGTIDIANSSRSIRESEVKSCADAGVTDIQQVKIGYDGIVFASVASGPAWALTPKDVWMALAEQVPVDGAMAPNPYKMWNEVNSSLPAQPIMAFIPAENHGTREVFVEKVLTAGCKEVPEVAALDKDAMTKACTTVRKDGLSVDIAGDYTETLARVESNPVAVGVFGLSFYEQNRDKVQVATVNGITPSTETIASGEYPVSRPLFFYVKKAHLGVIPGLKEYVEFFLSDQMVGEEGAAVEKGLIAMPEEELAAQRADFEAGKTLGQ